MRPLPEQNLEKHEPRPLAVLIVAYRAADKLERCITSVEYYLPENPVLIWDNSGPDFSGVRDLACKHPNVHWHFSDKNIGFAAAVNRLAEAVPDHDLLLINPDAELLGPLSSTRSALHEPGIAVAAPLQWVPEENAALSRRSRHPLWELRRMPWDVAYRKLTLINAFANSIGFSPRLRGTWLSISYRSQPDYVDGFLSGSCIAISRAAWDDVGPFDEEFFLYQEEAEWQRRARRAGWRLRLIDEVGLAHSSMGTVAGDPPRLTRSQDLAFANAVLMVEYCYGVRVAEAYLALSAWLGNRRQRRRGTWVPGHHDLVLTVDGDGAAVDDRGALARELLQAGYSVCVVSLQRLGSLQQDLPPDIRLIRRTWWWPSIAPDGSPFYFVSGDTKRERAFARLFRLRHPKAQALHAEDLVRLANDDRTS